MTETHKDKRSVTEIFQQVWSQALVAVTGAEEEASKLLQRVGLSPDEVKKQVREFAEKLAGQRREAERRVEEGVRQTLSKLRVPRRDEVEKLSSRLEALTRRVEAMSK